MFDRKVASPKTRSPCPGSGTQPYSSLPRTQCNQFRSRAFLSLRLLFALEQQPLRVPRVEMSDAPAGLAVRALARVLLGEVRCRRAYAPLRTKVRRLRVRRQAVEPVG